jgi:hypothetical protein
MATPPCFRVAGSTPARAGCARACSTSLCGTKRSDAPAAHAPNQNKQNKTNKWFSLFGAGHQLAKLRCKSLSLLSLHVYASSGFSDDDHATATTARLEPAAAAAAALGSMRSVGLALAV